MFAGPGIPALSQNKLDFIATRLTDHNRMRYCMILLALLVLPSFIFLSGGSGFMMLLIATVIALMLRNIDSQVGRILKSTNTANPKGASLFLLPLTIICGFSTIIDSIVLVPLFTHPHFSMAVLIANISVRVAILVTIVPLTRMMLDPNFQPAGLSASGQSDGLLLRQPVDSVERFQMNEVNVEPPPASTFQVFSGQGNVIAPTTRV